MPKAGRELALQGEEAAVAHLERNGLRLLRRNYRCPAGEVDIIALDGDTVVFVEVKTRRSAGFGSPAEAVDRRKQARLARVARWYLQEQRLAGAACRFDVAGVLVRDGRVAVEWVTDAFGC